MDSLGATEISGRLSSELGVRVPSTLLFSYPTLRDITSHMLKLVGVTAEADGEAGGEGEDIKFEFEYSNGFFTFEPLKPKLRILYFLGSGQEIQNSFPFYEMCCKNSYAFHVYCQPGRMDRKSENDLLHMDLVAEDAYEAVLTQGWFTNRDIPVVMIGTSFGSSLAVSILTLLQNNKFASLTPRHFISVSGLFGENPHLAPAASFFDSLSLVNSYSPEKVLDVLDAHNLAAQSKGSEYLQLAVATDAVKQMEFIRTGRKMTFNVDMTLLRGSFDNMVAPGEEHSTGDYTFKSKMVIDLPYDHFFASYNHPGLAIALNCVSEKLKELENK